VLLLLSDNVRGRDGHGCSCRHSGRACQLSSTSFAATTHVFVVLFGELVCLCAFFFIHGACRDQDNRRLKKNYCRQRSFLQKLLLPGGNDGWDRSDHQDH
jgi:hypothetical protein